MNSSLRSHAETIVSKAVSAVLPEVPVREALSGMTFPGRIFIVAVGKAAFRMAEAACSVLGSRVEKGVVVTKYGHVYGSIPGVACFEAGHPVPDANSFRAAQAAVDLVSGLTSSDTVLFLLSGGGSALFELPLVPYGELESITEQLLSCGASITEINTVRKRLSAVKAGRFALLSAPARIETIALSDIPGGGPDMIASGPTCPDPTTSEDALRVVAKYGLRLSENALELIKKETPKELSNANITVFGGVSELVRAAAAACRELGYEPFILTDRLSCEAREAGSFLASIVKTHSRPDRPLAFIAGGETVVHLTGSGVGGRNQELALSAAIGISGIKNAAVFSFGSDGTDGPTEAAGGYADGDTLSELAAHGISAFAALADNDSHTALKKAGGLIVTGPTGTNVNDAAVALIAADTRN